MKLIDIAINNLRRKKGRTFFLVSGLRMTGPAPARTRFFIDFKIDLSSFFVNFGRPRLTKVWKEGHFQGAAGLFGVN